MRTNIDSTLSRLARRPELFLQAKTRRGEEAAELDKQRLKQAAREFESLFLEQMVKEMRNATPKAELLGREKGHELFQEMLDGEFVRLMTDSGGIGLADFIVRSLAEKGITR